MILGLPQATPETTGRPTSSPLARNLVVSDRWVLQKLYLGDARLYDNGLWQPWVCRWPVGRLRPAGGLGRTLCLMATFRRQWIASGSTTPSPRCRWHHLAHGRLLRNKLFWSAFALGACWHSGPGPTT